MYNYEGLEDNELLFLLQKGDEKAFSELYNRYWKKLFIVASHRVHHLEDAEEIVQDIFAALWRRRKSLNITGELSHYLSVSVKYRVIKTLDKYYRQQRYVHTQPEQVENTTESILDFEELQSALAKYVKELPEKCQLVFRLSKEQGFSQKQIAEELSISEKTVEAHLGKAYKMLRTKLVKMIL